MDHKNYCINDKLLENINSDDELKQYFNRRLLNAIELVLKNNPNMKLGQLLTLVSTPVGSKDFQHDIYNVENDTILNGLKVRFNNLSFET